MLRLHKVDDLRNVRTTRGWLFVLYSVLFFGEGVLLLLFPGATLKAGAVYASILNLYHKHHSASFAEDLLCFSHCLSEAALLKGLRPCVRPAPVQQGVATWHALRPIPREVRILHGGQALCLHPVVQRSRW